ncbi:hypothetical protein F511_05425 [Dorcoceras hygrometricum]|uniref:Uncharacterized protein n=1 Tax=Dorcoceras hygrometricum TaxID=472368 RepID=A0A2Z7BG29_9LAMI|nr:hypothetical protein F511_05425 [Dorcoceras hygrometricum]
MRTETQVNGILPEYCSMETGCDGNANIVMKSLYNQDKLMQGGKNFDPSEITKDCIFGYGKGDIRKTILQHETIFRNQVRELHRLCIRQRELMNEMKRVKLNKEEHNIPFISLIQDTKNLTSSDVPLSKCISFEKRTDSLKVPANLLGVNVENQMQKGFYEFFLVETNTRNRNHQALCSNSAFTGAWRPEVDSSRPHYHTDLNFTFSAVGNPGSLSCLARADVSANSGSTFQLASTNLYENLHAGNKDEKRFEKHFFAGDSSFVKSQTCSKGTPAEQRNGFSDNHLSTCKPAFPKKQTLFGVEISGENDDPLVTVSNTSSIISKNYLVNCKDVGNGIAGKYFKNVDETNARPTENSERDSENSQKFQMVGPQHNLAFTDSRSNLENPNGVLTWFLKTPQQSSEPKKEANSSYFMNLDSLQNYSNEFFKKTERTGGSFPTLRAKPETSEPMAVQIADNKIPRTIIGFPICNALQAVKNPNSGCNISKVNCSFIDSGGRKEQLEIEKIVLQKRFNNCISGLRHDIDLNLSSEEEDAPPAPSVPTAIVKIATTEIDLEAPASIESEADMSPTEVDSTEVEVPPRRSEPSNEEYDRIAAQTIISFSSSGKKNSNEVAREPLDNTSTDCLKWFAEKILSNSVDTMTRVSSVQNGMCDADELIPHGMDLFEFMTLKLEDTKEHYSYRPIELNNTSDEETKRSRKGLSSRWRQLKDFQKDILPGLVTLSRQEVTEDLKTFEGLQLKVEGRNSPINGRGRKRLRVLATSPVSRSVYSAIALQPTCPKLGLEGGNILRWGIRTRRLPRQRCPNAHHPLPLKC